MDYTILNDNKLYKPANQLKPTDEAGVREFQDNSNDWVEIVTPGIGYTNVLDGVTAARYEVITFSDPLFIPSEIFRVGDRIRCKQGGSFKYFYVAKTGTASVYLRGGDTYTLTDSTAVTNLAYSRLTSPSGFPEVFTFTPVVSPNVGSVSLITGDLQFLMSGPIVSVGGTLNISVTSGSPTQLLIGLPIPFRTSSTIGSQSILALVVLGSTSDANISIFDFGPTTTYTAFRCRRITSAAYSSGFDINVSFNYRI